MWLVRIGGLLGGVASLICIPAASELQEVQVGGSIEIYWNYYTPFWEGEPSVRIPSFFLPVRPIGPFGTASWIRADSFGHSLDWIEQRTSLFFAADFAGNVRAYIELDSIEDWGEDSRSQAITGLDFRSGNSDDLEVYQGYIESRDLLGLPLAFRVGRQKLNFGSEWLVGNNFYWAPLTYLSFDALRLTYTPPNFELDLWWSKLAERSPLEADGDVDFYGVYGSYVGLENLVVDLYWMWVRDAQSLSDTNFSWFAEWFEEVLDLDDYDVTHLHTVGIRAAGNAGPWDLEAEAAYQWGDASQVGALFRPAVYGDDTAEFGNWGGHANLGYTFDVRWQPRLFVAAEYYGGEDNRAIGFWEWLFPFHKPDASISFNRLFSSWEEDSFLDTSALSNVLMLRAGLSAWPTKSLEVGLDLHYTRALETFDRPVSLRFGPVVVPVAPTLSFWTEKGSHELGREVCLWFAYAYSDDLSFEGGWAHFFTGEGLEDGAFVNNNGLEFYGSRQDQDADYFWLGTKLLF